MIVKKSGYANSVDQSSIRRKDVLTMRIIIARRDETGDNEMYGKRPRTYGTK